MFIEPDHNKFQKYTDKYRIPSKDLKPHTGRDFNPATIDALFPKLDQWAIGYRNIFEQLQSLSQAKAATYPPCNITKDGDKYEIVMAVAGFKREYLDISVKDSVLTVASNVDMEKGDIREVIHQGIAQRNFTHTFALADHVVVKEAKLQDGLLVIKLELELPEEKKPKNIEIQ